MEGIPSKPKCSQLLYPLGLCGIERLEIRRLREILTDKAVGVFVQLALTKMIWRGKEEQDRQRLGEAIYGQQTPCRCRP